MVIDAVSVAGMVAGAAMAVHGQEFQNYSAAEYKKADSDHDGALDAKELSLLRIYLRRNIWG
jgi:hypothetical protein